MIDKSLREQKKEQRFAKSIAVVTGAASGIGRAIAERLGAQGATLVLIDRDQTALEKVSDFETAERPALRIPLDCTDEISVVGAFERIYNELGRVDILVNNIGQSARERATEFYESSSDVWRFVIDTSLITTLLVSRQVVPRMRGQRQGKIVNISSNAAMSGEVKVSEYAAAKMGVIGFTRSLSRELAPFGVNVNAVCPGVTNTRALKQLPPDFVEQIRAKIPMGAVCEPEDIAAAVAFLVSADARFITGQSLVVDGGCCMV